MNEQSKKHRQILVEKDAFRNLITHTYRFGHQALRKSHEVLGICLGSISKDNNYKIKNAIPITHGENLLVNSNQHVQKIISQMKEKYNSKDLEVIGVYRSHIQNGFNLSEDDVENLLYFQREINPMSFIIIVNREAIQNDETFGLRSYTLKDISEGKEAEVDEILIEIEEPKSLQVFKWIQKFVEDYQKRNPILIKEVMEKEEKEGMNLQEIPQEGKKVSEDLFPESTFQTISEQLNQSVDEIVDQQLKMWDKDVTQGVINGNEQLLNTIIQIKENIPIGVNMVKNRVGNLINEALESFKGTIFRHINELKNADELFEKVNDIFRETNENIIEILNGKLSENSKKINKEMGTIDELNSKIGTNITNFKNKSKDIKTLIGSTKESISEETKRFNGALKQKIEDTNATKLNSLEELQEKISDIQEKQIQKVQDKLDKLQKVSNKMKDL